MKKRLYIALFIITNLFGLESYAQSIPVGMSFFDDYYRRAQLLGEYDSTASFTNRPIFQTSSSGGDIFDPDSTMFWDRTTNFDGLMTFGKEKGRIQLLPVSIINQINSHHPDGINDGAMIPAKGFQTLISAGFFVKYGPLSIQLKPEYVYAKNLPFDGYPQDYTNSEGVKFPSSPYSGIDFPERFGTEPYSRVFWGQSSIRLNVGLMSLGVSNENLWWGPGYRNTLLMTNSAPGFKHLTLNTSRPIKTWIGSFEGQLIAGKLEGSGYTENLRDDWRYINAMVLSYNPKWIPGLFLGATRSFLIYNEDMGNKIGDYLPVFSFLEKSGGGTNAEVNAQGQNQLISVFMRWLFPEAHGEIYFEYGREDHAWDTRDLILDAAHSSAYLVGFRKLVVLNKQKETYMQIIAETTNLGPKQTTINRNGTYNTAVASNWYTHSQIRHGYTNEGQILGAGIGPGSILQTLDLSWVRSLKQVGIQMERYVHNNDFWYNKIQDFRSNWVDISTMLYANWDYKNVLLSVKLKYIRSRNYEWIYEPEFTDPPVYFAPSKNTHNFHGQLGIMYRF